MIEATKKTLKELRRESALSQADIAEMLGVSQAAVSRFESGVQLPEAEARQKLEELYETQDIRFIDKNQIDLKWLRFTDPNAPKRSLKWWREERHLSTEELAELAGVSPRAINNIERGSTLSIRPKNRRALAKALMVAPDKLVLPGDDEAADPGFTDRTATLRAELRESRRTNRKMYDFVINDSNITFKGQDIRDRLLPELQRELRGT